VDLGRLPDTETNGSAFHRWLAANARAPCSPSFLPLLGSARRQAFLSSASLPSPTPAGLFRGVLSASRHRNQLRGSAFREWLVADA
jgi:hypothetical protein